MMKEYPEKKIKQQTMINGKLEEKKYFYNFLILGITLRIRHIQGKTFISVNYGQTLVVKYTLYVMNILSILVCIHIKVKVTRIYKEIQ